MKFAFLTTNAADIEKAGRLGFDGVELNASAFGKAGARALDADKIGQAKQLCAKHGVEITALAYYDLAFSPPAAGQVTNAYARVFDAAETLGVRTITSMSGFDASRDWAGNLQLFAERLGPVAELAEARGLRVAIENWMGFGGRLPFKPINMGGAPDTWDD